jgi:hypothetical protein
MNKVIRVTKTEFELDNGDVFPIAPELDKEMSPEEFQAHYERAYNIVQSLKNAGGDDKNNKGVDV